jgi:hypothetical protein
VHLLVSMCVCGCVCLCVPELKVPLASSGDTSLDRRDMMTPSRAFKKTKTRMEPQMYCIRDNKVIVRVCV